MCHLPHTDVRMGMTQQGNFFVVLFYLFLDNEKSAEGLAWGWLSQIFAHETHPRPYGSSVGGYLTLMTLWHQKNRTWSLFFRELPWIHTSMQGVWKTRVFFGFVCFFLLLWVVSHLLSIFWGDDRCSTCQQLQIYKLGEKRSDSNSRACCGIIDAIVGVCLCSRRKAGILI